MTDPLQIDPSQVDNTASGWDALLADLGFTPPSVNGSRPTHQAAAQGYRSAQQFTDEVKARQAALAAQTAASAGTYQGQDQAGAKGLSL